MDDYPDTIEMYSAYLEIVGFRPLKAGNGRDAIFIAGAELPDIILMDLSLPALDGIEVTRRLKDDPRTRHIPVVAFTAHATHQQFEQLLACGFHDLIMKPCLPDVLAEQVAHIIGEMRLPGSEQSGTAQPAA
ncbi:MAG: response regulator [Bacteroidales bacterium]